MFKTILPIYTVIRLNGYTLYSSYDAYVPISYRMIIVVYYQIKEKCVYIDILIFLRKEDTKK